MSAADRVQRNAYIQGLRQLADLLEAHPELPLPTHGQPGREITTHYLFSGDPKGDLAAFVRAVPGRVEKEPNGAYFYVRGRIAGLHVNAVAYRDAVCERVVTGVETVTETVPDPDAPLVEVTRQVEQVEWRCPPILAADDAETVTP